MLGEVGRRAGGGPAVGRTAERIRTMAALLERLGAGVDVVRDGGTVWRIEGRGSPLSAVVRDQSIACAVIESLIPDATSALVTRCCRHGEPPRCSFRIEER